jgi:hypothetical protein
MWDRREVEKIEKCVGRYVVAFAFRCVIQNFEWAFVGVYGPNDDAERIGLWDDLVGLMTVWEMLWCIFFLCTLVKELVILGIHKHWVNS